MGQANERERLREEKEAQYKIQQEEYVQKIVGKTKKDYENIRELLPEVNPKAWKALLSLRAQVRRVRSEWKHLCLSTHKIDEETKKKALLTQQEKDILVGQYNSVMLVFDIVEQIRDINKHMTPGKEADYIRQRVFGNQQGRR